MKITLFSELIPCIVAVVYLSKAIIFYSVLLAPFGSLWAQIRPALPLCPNFSSMLGLLFYTEGRSRMFLRNVNKHLPGYKTLNPTKQ
jgi:hypothetical protein